MTCQNATIRHYNFRLNQDLKASEELIYKD